MSALLGLVVVLVAVAVATASAYQSRLDRATKSLLGPAVLLRLAGAGLYCWMMQAYYGGGDFLLYHREGVGYADRWWGMDFSMFTDSSEWYGGQWWGTQFVMFPAGIVSALFGHHLVSSFFVFSILAFLGLVGFGTAFRRSFPDVPLYRYLRWIWLFPSLWFWSAAPGKDALLLLGLGLGTVGFVGTGGRIGWVPLVVGVFITFGVRPQVAALLVFTMIFAHWLTAITHWNATKGMQGLIIVAAGLWFVGTALHSQGAGGLDRGELQSYVDARAARAARGANDVEGVSLSLTGAPVAAANVLFRPLPGEGQSATLLIASLEVWGVWVAAFAWRRSILNALREVRRSRLLSFAALFFLLYGIMLGMVVVNLGIIARQRIFLFPYLFMFFEARPPPEAAPRGSGEGARSWPGGRRIRPGTL